ncbi:HAD family hydrolase, partial [Mucilaginibacter sp. 5C4]|nr:HAD family hydrolase [Mucilaginibacter sp. 5C4]
TQNTLSIEVVNQIIYICNQMLNQPIDLLDGVEGVLDKLKGKYSLVVATKGDLLDQERKQKKS